jgi:hypothetical protein
MGLVCRAQQVISSKQKEKLKYSEGTRQNMNNGNVFRGAITTRFSCQNLLETSDYSSQKKTPVVVLPYNEPSMKCRTTENGVRYMKLNIN